MQQEVVSATLHICSEVFSQPSIAQPYPGQHYRQLRQRESVKLLNKWTLQLVILHYYDSTLTYPIQDNRMYSASHSGRHQTHLILTRSLNHDPVPPCMKQQDTGTLYHSSKQLALLGKIDHWCISVGPPRDRPVAGSTVAGLISTTSRNAGSAPRLISS